MHENRIRHTGCAMHVGIMIAHNGHEGKIFSDGNYVSEEIVPISLIRPVTDQITSDCQERSIQLAYFIGYMSYESIVRP